MKENTYGDHREMPHTALSLSLSYQPIWLTDLHIIYIYVYLIFNTNIKFVQIHKLYLAPHHIVPSDYASLPSLIKHVASQVELSVL